MKRTKGMKHLGTKQIETDRLLLRRFMLTDAEAMWNNWAADPKVTEYLTWPSHEDIDVTKNTLADWINSYNNEDFYLWLSFPKHLANQ